MDKLWNIADVCIIVFGLGTLIPASVMMWIIVAGAL